MSPPNPSFCCAFAMADRNTFAMSWLMPLRVNCSVASAWFTSRPRIRSITSPAFWAEVRTYLAVACASIMANSRLRPASRRLRLRAAATASAARRRAAAICAAFSVFVVCPLNWRVGENSPSFCPTMFSVTYTGMNFLPLCTASVCPTISVAGTKREPLVVHPTLGEV